MKATNAFLTANILLSLAGATQAALYDRGNGMIYDSTQNITWLQDANYAQTSGYDDNDGMDWNRATAWASNLTYKDFSDWRLPSAKPNGNIAQSYNGSTDYGYNNTRSEIGHLFTELGNIAVYDKAGNYQNVEDFGVLHSTFIDAGTHQSVSFLNVDFAVYWQAEAYNFENAFSFNFLFGEQRVERKYYDNSVWVVRDGDVAAVPVPAAAWLFGSGLIGLAGAARRRKR